MKNRTRKFICMAILLPCILFLSQDFAYAYNITIDGAVCSSEYGDAYNERAIYSCDNMKFDNLVAAVCIAKIVDKDAGKLYLGFDVGEKEKIPDVVDVNPSVSALKIAINDTYEFICYCNDTLKPTSCSGISIVGKCKLYGQNPYYGTELCIDFKGKMPKSIDLSIWIIDRTGDISREISLKNIEDGEVAKTDSTQQSTTASGQTKATTKAETNATTAAVKAAGNSTTVDAVSTKSSKTNSAVKNTASDYTEYTLQQNNSGNEEEDAPVQLNSSGADSDDQIGSKFKSVIGIIIAVALLAVAAILPVLQHKGPKKKNETPVETAVDDAEDGAGSEDENSEGKESRTKTAKVKINKKPK